MIYTYTLISKKKALFFWEKHYFSGKNTTFFEIVLRWRCFSVNVCALSDFQDKHSEGLDKIPIIGRFKTAQASIS